ncbi:hypothetical protein [Rhodovarius lipocyclicus]|uniref:hypothetical protein n=1 Tax=Rhodovarius lipocyclicus TaxID=268410 RepID=UPI001358A6D6|nr:hypothetical protein [Rhodovarius lipocyclicus]
MNDDAFFIIWCPTGRQPPTRRHPTREIAEHEARRLAALAPGQSFYVLAALSVSSKVDVTTRELRPTDLQIPF